MKTLRPNCRSPRKAVILFFIFGLALLAASRKTSAEDQAAVTVGTAAATQPKLPYGVKEVLKLTRAKISEDVVVNYIQNSGMAYNLTSSDIVYLRNEGVSDRVINAMLDQSKTLETAQNQADNAPPAAAPAPAPASAPIPAPTQAPQVAVNPAPVYVQPPSPSAPSTVYVIPYPPATSAYYGYYQPYYGYYGAYYAPYYGPTISLGFGFGGYWGGHHGAWGGHYGGHWGGGHHWRR